MEKIEHSNVAQDPLNNTPFCKPTENAESSGVRNPHHFLIMFDQPPFVQSITKPVFDKFKRKIMDKDSNHVRSQCVAVSKRYGQANQDWLDEHKLGKDLMPIEFFEAFFPRCLTETWTTYTNRKAWLNHAGEEGHPYPNFEHFTAKELRQHLGVRIFHGISPSPRLMMKFQTQAKDTVNDNNFVACLLGPNATQRHKHFRHLFACQNPVQKHSITQRGPKLQSG